jgi:di/tricarboxylate transporter
MMVMGPGGYQFGDYWKVGLPLLLLSFAEAVVVVPVFWSF